MSKPMIIQVGLASSTALGLPQIAATIPKPAPGTFMKLQGMPGSRSGRDPHGLTPEEARRERAIAASVQKLLESLSAEYGSVAQDIKVMPPTLSYWKRISVTMTGYGDHGVPEAIHRYFDIAPKSKIDEEQILLRVTSEYRRFFDKQRSLAETYGGPKRKWEVGDVDLSLYSIEAPVWRYLQARLGDKAEAALRRILLAGSEVSLVTLDRAAGVEMGDLRITTSRGLIRGEFTIADGPQKVRWAKGSLKVEGLELSDTVAQSIRGSRLGDVVAHPLLVDDIEITSAQPSTRKNRVGVVFDTKNGTLSLPVVA